MTSLHLLFKKLVEGPDDARDRWYQLSPLRWGSDIRRSEIENNWTVGTGMRYMRTPSRTPQRTPSRSLSRQNRRPLADLVQDDADENAQ